MGNYMSWIIVELNALTMSSKLLHITKKLFLKSFYCLTLCFWSTERNVNKISFHLNCKTLLCILGPLIDRLRKPERSII